MALVNFSFLGKAPFFEMISFEEAQQRLNEGKPVFWHHKYLVCMPREDHVRSQTGTNTVTYVTAWKTLPFPKEKPSSSKLSSPDENETGWWFGKPVTRQIFDENRQKFGYLTYDQMVTIR